MKEEKRIVLFIEKYELTDEKELVSRLEEKFPKLGKAVVFTDNKNNKMMSMNFTRGSLKLVISRRDVSFTFERNNMEAEELLFEIMIVLEEYFNFIRMGYISSYGHTKQERENFIENVFKDNKMITSEFQLSWYKSELIDSVKVNVWERHITDIARGVEFISIFDINTPVNEKNNINEEFLKNFLKKCDKFIRDRINDRF